MVYRGLTATRCLKVSGGLPFSRCAHASGRLLGSSAVLHNRGSGCHSSSAPAALRRLPARTRGGRWRPECPSDRAQARRPEQLPRLSARRRHCHVGSAAGGG
ncbi:hypothetical protein NDU88_003733 [Pleurodeles waltl]|uniref:Uncharacterized protein n=1 Tax=Pleurodeles waltl TaxID=8319 RepID=A0AAV7SGS0_PLEWA|nr:hypothetical protein NDU88_003733 [Pleurodeles waltl]